MKVDVGRNVWLSSIVSGEHARLIYFDLELGTPWIAYHDSDLLSLCKVESGLLLLLTLHWRL